MARGVVTFRFSAAELAEIDRRAEEAGLDRTAWVRRRLLGKLVEEDGRLTGERWRQVEIASPPYEDGHLLHYRRPMADAAVCGVQVDDVAADTTSQRAAVTCPDCARLMR